MKSRVNSIDIKKLTYIALLTAIVFLLQFLARFFQFATFSLTFVLVPIVVGVALCGVAAGAWLGFAFGLAVFLTGDAALFLQFNIVGTIITVMLKGTLSGFFAGLVYKLLEKKNRYVAIFAAALTAPIVNTGIFFLGSLIFFFDSIAAFWNLAAGEVVPFIITGLIGINFIIEVVINIVLAPTIYRIININKKV
jgi:uncharacterized membrane protein